MHVLFVVVVLVTVVKLHRTDTIIYENNGKQSFSHNMDIYEFIRLEKAVLTLCLFTSS